MATDSGVSEPPAPEGVVIHMATGESIECSVFFAGWDKDEYGPIAVWEVMPHHAPVLREPGAINMTIDRLPGRTSLKFVGYRPDGHN
jgi:hypothetical protein